jgi:mono/diheme cytochrome c family protein
MAARAIAFLFALSSVVACDHGDGATQSDPATLPWSDETPKADVFGRSLVGAPSPYSPDAALVADPASAANRLAGDMRARRRQGWLTALEVLEPVPLLGLADQIDARPDCPPGVSDKHLDACAKHDGTSCAAASSDGVADICTWDDAAASCAPSCDNITLPDGSEIPRIPRFESWYGVEDLNHIFRDAYAHLGPDGQLARDPLSDPSIGAAMLSDHSEIDRSRRWPLQRYTAAVMELFGCDLVRAADESDDDYAERCAVARQSEFSGAAAPGGGIARILYSPAMALHTARNYAEVLGCRDDVLADTWCVPGEPCEDPPEDFATCFRSEFPADAGDPWGALEPDEIGQAAVDTLSALPDAGGTAIVKAVWSRVGFGFEMPAYDTDATSLARRIGPGERAEWEPAGDRRYGAEFPTPQDIYTIETSSGARYRLTALHVMTKELRHWQWVTLWWSDAPDDDFGADRPPEFDTLPAVWGNYKMCVVVDYTESDPDVLERFADLPSLQGALAVTDPTVGSPTWCSNPYVEQAPGNARTNCIGCHQHAGSRFDESGAAFDLTEVILDESALLDDAHRYPANGRLRRRTSFATDYSWAFSRIDDLTELMRTEVEFRGGQDARWKRIDAILAGDGDAVAGEQVFRATTTEQQCAGCHGDDGLGGFGPSLAQAFAHKTAWQLAHTVIDGRGSMPAWGDRLDDRQLGDLFAFLQQQFAD